MCAGPLLANRELYLMFLRMLNSIEILQDSEVEPHPVLGSVDPTSLITMSRQYKAILKPRDKAALREALNKFGEKEVLAV